MVDHAEAMRALLQLLTDGQVSARGRGHEGRPLLAVAAAAGRAPAVELLLRHSADVDAPDRRFGSGATPLVLASVHGHVSVVQMLLAVSCKRRTVWRGRTAAEWAGRRGHSECARLIRRGGAPGPAEGAPLSAPALQTAFPLCK